ncbi:MAG: phage terminase large subunit [Candidatus Brocadiales bacterium]|nr:phage terminase large subunit [Candidatus Brocadiales bacterium]
MRKTIQDLENEFGKKATVQWLRQHYEKPENIVEYLNLFPNHITSKTPEFHKEILLDMPLGGREADVAPRGFAKSTLTNVIGGSWFSLYNKANFILLISDTYTQAKLQLGALKAELEENEILHDIYGNPVSKHWGEDRIIINGLNGQTMIMALGSGMKIRGLKYKQYRPELAIIDDLENQDIVSSKDRRDKLERWFEYDLIPGLAKDGGIIYLGTILHHASLLKKVSDKIGKYASWRVKKYKAITDGQSIWPDRFSTEKLIAMRDDPNDPDYVGSLVFAQEYQNEPQSDTDRIFKEDWLNQTYNYHDKKHLWLMSNQDHKDEDFNKQYFKRILAGVDLAISEKETADYFTMTTIGVAREDGHIYILDYYRERISEPMKQIQVILDKYKEWDHDQIKVETVAYQQALYNLLRSEMAKRGIYAPIKSVKPDKDKVRRARVHSSNFSGKLVHLREDHPLFMAFKSELLEFPLGDHDDMLDSYMYATDETIKSRSRAFKKKPAIFR